MISKTKARAALQEIPSVDEIISHFNDSLKNAPYSLYLKTIRSIVSEIRAEILAGISIPDVAEYTLKKAELAINENSRPNLKRVINGTGIILHTGLGRAPLENKMLHDAIEQIYPYSNLELDLKTGKRGERTSHVEPLLKALTGSESALVVNNNAAAVLLMLNALAEGKEVIISRGEQVEIGGSFRIPDVIRKSGCIMVEVGTTNKTHLKDYKEAINKNTGAILVAHTSNYKVIGFTQSVDIAELNGLAKKNRIPLLLDLGSGAIADFEKLHLPHEPVVKLYIKAGAAVVSFSGDKLLGGPQAGIICGKKILIHKIQKNPLYRAMRCDKLSYAILENSLRSYLTPTDIHSSNLSMSLFTRRAEELIKLAKKVIKNLPVNLVKNYGIEIKFTKVEAGSGSLPLERFPSVALIFNGDTKAQLLAQLFRNSDPAILGYISGSKFHIDLKAVPDDLMKLLTASIEKVLK